MKAFIVTNGEKRGTLNVQCPHTDCGVKFVIGRAWLKGWASRERLTYKTASCPNCFKTSERVRP